MSDLASHHINDNRQFGSSPVRAQTREIRARINDYHQLGSMSNGQQPQLPHLRRSV